MKVKIDQLADAINFELASYREDVLDGLTSAIKDAASFCAKILRENSPKRTENYAKSWIYRMAKSSDKPSALVYNKEFWALTHLLEHGHAKQDGGRVEGIPHIDPAIAKTEDKLSSDLPQILEDITK